MHKFILTTIIAFLAINIGLYAQEKDTAQTEPKIKLELVWKKEFESPVLDFSLTEINDIPILQVVVTTDKVQVLTGKNVKEIGTKSIRLSEKENLVYGASLSKNGKYIGISEYHYGEYGHLLEGSRYYVYDNSGQLLSTKKATENSHPSILLNNGAVLVTGVLEDGRIFLEQLDGTKKIIFDYDDMRPSTYIGMAKNRNVFVVNITKVGVILYDDHGEKKWKRMFTWGDAANVTISDNGKYIAAVGILEKGGVYLLSSNNELLWKYPPNSYYNFYLNCMDFSPDEEYFAANINRDDIYLFESSTGKILWHYKSGEKNGMLRKFFSIAVSRNGVFVAATDGGGCRELPAGDTSFVFLFNKNGHIVWQKGLQIQREKTPRVQFSDDGEYLFICNSNMVYCYRIVGGEK